MKTQEKINMILKFEREQKISAERKIIDLAETLVTRLENNLSDLGKADRAEMIFTTLHHSMGLIERAQEALKNSSHRISLLEQVSSEED